MASRYKATVVLVGSVHRGYGDLGLNLDGHLTSLGARCLASMLPSRKFLLIGLFALRMSGVFAAGELTVIIDPGHGGTNVTGTYLLKSNSSPNNATSPSGLREKDLTRELSREIQRAFESERVSNHTPKIRCILTRTNDWNPDFAERAKVAADSRNPGALVSIHFNTFRHGAALGTVALIHSSFSTPSTRQTSILQMGLLRLPRRPYGTFSPAR